jgi:hypothetical protein
VTVDILLRISSVVALLLLLYQVFGSRGGSIRHNWSGIALMAFGFVIAVLVTIRAVRHEEGLTLLYGLHLLAGGGFLASLFTTGVIGLRTAFGLSHSVARHRILGRLTLVLLVATLLLGVVSALT